MRMVNLVRFDTGRKFLNLRNVFDFTTELKSAYIETGMSSHVVEAQIDSWKLTFERLIRDIVNTVKNCPETQSTFHVELTQSSVDLGTPHLIFVAKALYRLYGIEIQQVDAMTKCRKMVVGWPSDAPVCNNQLKYWQQARKNKLGIDYNLKLPERDFFVHKMFLASRVPYFDKILQGAFNDGDQHVVTVEGVKASSFEIFVDYIYTAEVRLKGQPAPSLCSLVRLANFYGLTYFKEKCFEEMCTTVNADNLLELLECAALYELDTVVLLEYAVDEVRSENVEQWIEIARTHNLEGFEQACIQQVLTSYKKEPPDILKLMVVLDVFERKQLQAFKKPLEDNICAVMQRCWGSISADQLLGYLQFTCEHAMISMRKCCETRVFYQLTTKDPDEGLSLEQVDELLRIATKHKRTDIVEACENELIKIAPEDVDTIQVLANKFNLLRLQAACQNH
jgi:hypothetical protein